MSYCCRGRGQFAHASRCTAMHERFCNKCPAIGGNSSFRHIKFNCNTFFRNIMERQLRKKEVYDISLGGDLRLSFDRFWYSRISWLTRWQLLRLVTLVNKPCQCTVHSSVRGRSVVVRLARNWRGLQPATTSQSKIYHKHFAKCFSSSTLMS